MGVEGRVEGIVYCVFSSLMARGKKLFWDLAVLL